MRRSVIIVSKQGSGVSNIEFRAIIKFLIKQKKSVDTILKEMQAVHKDACPSKTLVYKLVSLFKQSKEPVEDDEQLGRPSEITWF